MRLAVKILGPVIALFLVLVIGAGIWLSTLDLNAYKPQIAQVLTARLGRQVELNGEIKFTVWPQLGIQIKDVTLSNADWAQSEMPLAKIHQLQVKVDNAALLAHQIIVREITLQQAEFNLQQKGGQQNWLLDFTTAAKPKNEAAAESAPAKAQKIQQAPFNMQLEKIKFEDVTINYQKDIVRPLQLMIKEGKTNLNNSAPFDLALKGKLRGQVFSVSMHSPQPLLQWLDGGDQAAPLQLALQLGNNEIKLDGEGRSLKTNANFKGSASVKIEDWQGINALLDKPLPLAQPLTASADIEAANQSAADLRNFTLTMGDTAASGALMIGWQPGLKIKGNLDIPQLDLAIFQPPSSAGSNAANTQKSAASSNGIKKIPDITLPLDAIKNYQLHLALTLGELMQDGKSLLKDTRANVQVGGDVLQISQAQFKFAGQPMQGAITMDARSGGHLALNLHVDQLDSAALLKAFNLPPLLQTKMDAALEFAGNGARLSQLLANSGGKLNIMMGGGQVDQSTLGLLGNVALEFAAPMLKDVPKQIAIHCGQLQTTGANGVWPFKGALDSPVLANIQRGQLDFKTQQIEGTLSTHLKIVKIKAELPDVMISGNIMAPRMAAQPIQSIGAIAGQFVKGLKTPQSSLAALFQNQPDLKGAAACQALLNLKASAATTPQDSIKGALQNRSAPPAVIEAPANGTDAAPAGTDPTTPPPASPPAPKAFDKMKTKDFLQQGLQGLLGQ